VLLFDFSIEVSGDIASEFRLCVNECVADFASYYGLEIDIHETSVFVTLRRTARAVKEAGGLLYVMVDEYDRFANKLLFDRRDLHDAAVRARSGDTLIRSFFETLKAINTVFPCRIFVTRGLCRSLFTTPLASIFLLTSPTSPLLRRSTAFTQMIWSAR
jgi:hypothetical protein